MKFAIITPTKDRPDDIRKMLHSFMMQTKKPDQVIIVDSSTEPISHVIDEYPSLKINYYRWTKKPSAAGQRNGGIALLHAEIDLVCFFDDDQVLHADAIENMITFWESDFNRHLDFYSGKEHNYDDVKPLGAASFYDDSWIDLRPSTLKKSVLSKKLGLYTNKPGGVAPSGWQSLYCGHINDENMDVGWMSSQSIVLKRILLKEYTFDEFFEGYSYLEDLDFTYSIGKKYRMTVVANARFDHFHSPAGRVSRLNFGKIEILNRRYIVKKHNLSMASFSLAMLIRFVMSVGSGQFSRAWGNILGALASQHR